MEFEDVPQSIHIWKQDIRVDADRLIGQNDTSLGVQSSEQRTLGEIRLRAGYAEVRMDLIVKRLKEPMEELWQARHNIYQRMLADQPDGMPLPQTIVMGLQARGVDTQSILADGRITAQMLDGQWWFKPRGSVDSADPQVQQAYFNQFLAVLPALMKMNPMIASILQQPQAAKAFIEQAMRIFRWDDKQAILGPQADAVIQRIQTQQEMQQQQQEIMQDPRFQMLMAMAHGGVPGGGLPPPAQGAMPPGMPMPAQGQPPPGLPMGGPQ